MSGQGGGRYLAKSHSRCWRQRASNVANDKSNTVNSAMVDTMESNMGPLNNGQRPLVWSTVDFVVAEATSDDALGVADGALAHTSVCPDFTFERNVCDCGGGPMHKRHDNDEDVYQYLLTYRNLLTCSLLAICNEAAPYVAACFETGEHICHTTCSQARIFAEFTSLR